jgi:hypothetical protein
MFLLREQRTGALACGFSAGAIGLSKKKFAPGAPLQVN